MLHHHYTNVRSSNVNIFLKLASLNSLNGSLQIEHSAEVRWRCLVSIKSTCRDKQSTCWGSTFMANTIRSN